MLTKIFLKRPKTEENVFFSYTNVNFILRMQYFLQWKYFFSLEHSRIVWNSYCTALSKYLFKYVPQVLKYSFWKITVKVRLMKTLMSPLKKWCLNLLTNRLLFSECKFKKSLIFGNWYLQYVNVSVFQFEVKNVSTSMLINAYVLTVLVRFL